MRRSPSCAAATQAERALHLARSPRLLPSNPGIFLLAMSMELALPLHAAVQAAVIGLLLSDEYSRNICTMPPLVSPTAILLFDCSFATADWLAVPLLLPPPGLLHPGTPHSRCRAVMALLQLAIGLALPVALTAIREARQFTNWCALQRSAGASGGWQAAMYRHVQSWRDLACMHPINVGMLALLMVGLAWHTVVLTTVPPGNRK